MLHKPNNNNIIQALAATRYERVKAEYASTKSSYKPPGKFSGGYAKALELLEMEPILNEGLLFQGYKYACCH